MARARNAVGDAWTAGRRSPGAQDVSAIRRGEGDELATELAGGGPSLGLEGVQLAAGQGRGGGQDLQRDFSAVELAIHNPRQSNGLVAQLSLRPVTVAPVVLPDNQGGKGEECKSEQGNQEQEVAPQRRGPWRSPLSALLARCRRLQGRAAHRGEDHAPRRCIED
jgi:hypothetical protein